MGTKSLALDVALMFCCRLFSVGHTYCTPRHAETPFPLLYSVWNFCKGFSFSRLLCPQAFIWRVCELAGIMLATVTSKLWALRGLTYAIKVSFLHIKDQ